MKNSNRKDSYCFLSLRMTRQGCFDHWINQLISICNLSWIYAVLLALQRRIQVLWWKFSLNLWNHAILSILTQEITSLFSQHQSCQCRIQSRLWKPSRNRGEPHHDHLCWSIELHFHQGLLRFFECISWINPFGHAIYAWACGQWHRFGSCSPQIRSRILCDTCGY